MGIAVKVPNVDWSEKNLGQVHFQNIGFDVKVTSINIKCETLENGVIEGTHATFTYVCLPIDSTQTKSTFSVVSGNEYASITEDGLLTINDDADGNVTIKCRNDIWGVETELSFRVIYSTAIKMKTLEISNNSDIINGKLKASTTTFEYKYTPQNATFTDVTFSIIEGGEYAQITPEGVLTYDPDTIVSNQTVTIKCQSNKYPSISDTMTFTVVSASQMVTVYDYATVSPASCYVNTGYVPTQETEVEMSIKIHALPSAWAVFGSRTTNASADRFAFHIAPPTKQLNVMYSTIQTGNVTYQFTPETLYTFTMNKNGGTLNGSEFPFSSTTTSFTSTLPIYLFAFNQAGSPFSLNNLANGFDFYECKIRENGMLIHHYVPAWNEEVGYCKLYDEVTDEWLTAFNENSSTFISNEDTVFAATESIILVNEDSTTVECYTTKNANVVVVDKPEGINATFDGNANLLTVSTDGTIEEDINGSIILRPQNGDKELEIMLKYLYIPNVTRARSIHLGNVTLDNTSQNASNADDAVYFNTNVPLTLNTNVDITYKMTDTLNTNSYTNFSRLLGTRDGVDNNEFRFGPTGAMSVDGNKKYSAVTESPNNTASLNARDVTFWTNRTITDKTSMNVIRQTYNDGLFVGYNAGVPSNTYKPIIMARYANIAQTNNPIYIGAENNASLGIQCNVICDIYDVKIDNGNKRIWWIPAVDGLNKACFLDVYTKELVYDACQTKVLSECHANLIGKDVTNMLPMKSKDFLNFAGWSKINSTIDTGITLSDDIKIEVRYQYLGNGNDGVVGFKDVNSEEQICVNVNSIAYGTMQYVPQSPSYNIHEVTLSKNKIIYDGVDVTPSGEFVFTPSSNTIMIGGTPLLGNNYISYVNIYKNDVLIKKYEALSSTRLYDFAQ